MQEIKDIYGSSRDISDANANLDEEGRLELQSMQRMKDIEVSIKTLFSETSDISVSWNEPQSLSISISLDEDRQLTDDEEKAISSLALTTMPEVTDVEIITGSNQ